MVPRRIGPKEARRKLDVVVVYLELALAMALAVTAKALVFRILRDRKEPRALKNQILYAIRAPSTLGAAFIGAAVALPSLKLAPESASLIQELTYLALIAACGWTIAAILSKGGTIVRAHYHAEGEDSILARKVHTRVDVVGKVLTVFVVIITGGAMLMTFPGVRSLGTSILASAGLIGIVAGLAAQPLLTNLFAGLQIALTEPLRLEDVVVMSAPTSPSTPYWGTVEEITAAYVVIKVWDLRRLIVPLTYILSQPFENWTYRSSELLGNVMVYADYRVDVEAMRRELKRILDATPLWDGKIWSLQVTSLSSATNPYAVGLRAVFSVRNSADRWDLSVLVQEKLTQYLAEKQPAAIPRMRYWTGGAETGDEAGHRASRTTSEE